MFSGIIQAMGEVVSFEKNRLTVRNSEVAKCVLLGSSVAISGVCLTVAKQNEELFSFDVMNETLKKTTLGGKKSGDRVNIETSLRAGDDIGGHFVYGHVDGVAEITEIAREGDAMLLTLRLPKPLMKYIVPQGSVAIDGVSLTVAGMAEDTFTVSLVPYTLEHTTLYELDKGGKVNIECDTLDNAS